MCIDTQDQTIYLLGGWDGYKDLGDFWRFHIPEGRWELISHNTERYVTTKPFFFCATPTKDFSQFLAKVDPVHVHAIRYATILVLAASMYWVVTWTLIMRLRTAGPTFIAIQSMHKNGSD